MALQDQTQPDKIYTRDEAARLLEIFDDVLNQYGIRVPSPEDDEREEDNIASLYGSTYANLMTDVETRLINLLERKTSKTEIIQGIFSGSY